MQDRDLELKKFANILKDVTKDKTIPLLTTDTELVEVLYRGKIEEKIFESCGVSSELINTSGHVALISNRI